MLEGLVAGLLNRFLGMYVKNFDPTQLKVGIWGGDVKLSQLELRREALDQLKLPINVIAGHLGELTLNIPWSNLRGEPVRVTIEDVFLLASPKEEAEYNEEEEAARKQRLKMEKLDSAELLKERTQAGLSLEEQKRSQSFTESLVTKIVDNLQVDIKNIHIRYEDAISAPGHPFSLGITLENFSAVSTDSEWNQTYIQDSTSTTHKLATLESLAVYWNTDTKLMGPGREARTPDSEIMPHEEMLNNLRSLIAGSSNEVADHQFILKPVSGQAKIELDKTGSPTAPKFKANLLFDEIGVVLDDQQYRDALMMIDLFHYFIRHQEYKKLQPKGVTPKEDPRAWFRFAGEAVLSKIHEKNRRWSWEYFKERRDDRRRYIELFKKRKQNLQLTAEEAEDMKKLEWKLSYEDLRFWRSLARNQLKRENAEALKQRQEPQQQQGWLSWVWGTKQQPEEEKQDDMEYTRITEEQRKELYEVIDWDEKAALAAEIDIPRETIKMQIETSLSTGSFTLRQSPHGTTRDLISVHFDVFKAKGLKRPDSFFVDLSLGGLRVNDGTTPNSLYKEIVRVKDAPTQKDHPRLSIAELEGVKEEAFFHLQLEQNPLDGQGDVAVTAKLKPLEIVWNPNVVIGVVDFFRPPERHMESITALMETAGATVEGLREQTRAGLQFALEEHKTVNAKLDLQAPLIIVPESVTSTRSQCVILDAGHISVTSELVDEQTTKEVQSKQSQAYTDEDLKRLESLMYDRFNVKLTSTQVLIGPSVDETKRQLAEQDDRRIFHIVDKINVDFVVEMSILPKAPNLTKFKISGHMPVLQVTASDSKYKTLMRIIEVAIPRVGGDQGQPAEATPKRPRLESSASARSRRPSEMPRPTQILPFVVQQEAIVIDDDDDDDSEKFEDAKGSSPDEQLRIKQRLFVFRFTVDKLRGSLYRSDPDRRRPDQLLVELVAEDFGVEFQLRPFDMSAEVSLGSVTVDDFVENPPAEFKSIVSSGDVEDRRASRDLVHVKFCRVRKESPEFMSVHEGIETSVDVAISTINLVVTRKTLLTLLDFILVTFTNNQPANGTPNKPITDSDSEVSSDSEVEPPPPPAQTEAGLIRVRVDLKSIRMILNNDGIRLATLSFNHGDVCVSIRGPTMRVSTKLGNLSLVDDVNVGVPRDSSLRQLVTIQGDELADFHYETFDATKPEGYPGYDSSIFLRAGSVRVNFVEEPFRKIVDFLVKFGKMQAIYNAARQAAANQANQLQQSQSRIKFDVVIKTPIVVFPRVVSADTPKRDVITAYLGEIYAQNKFAPLDDSENSEIAMKLSAGIRNIRLTSLFHYSHDRDEELELIDHVDLGFKITYAEHKEGLKRPDLEIDGNMTDFHLRITPYQLKSLLEISRSVPAAFASDVGQHTAAAERDVDNATLQRARTMPSYGGGGKEPVVDMSPELGTHGEAWTKLDLVFKVNEIGLELINASEDAPVGDLDAASLTKFSLNSSRLKTRMDSNGSVEAEFVVQTLNIYDTRHRETNKFRRIMTSSNTGVDQLMASVTVSGGEVRNVIAVVAIDSPRFIFSLDHVFALQRFITVATQTEEPALAQELTPNSPEEMSDADSVQALSRMSLSESRSPSIRPGTPSTSQPEAVGPKTSVAYRVNIVDAQVILIANPLITNSEAIVLGTKEVVLSQQHALMFQVSQCGMFLCRMDRFDDSRLRIIDDFSLQVAIDQSQPAVMKIHADIEPLILRLSLRDILLVMQTLAKASELSEGAQGDAASSQAAQKPKGPRTPGLKKRPASSKTPSTSVARTTRAKSTVSALSARGGQHQPHDIVKPPPRFEELTVAVDGVRVILLGDIHELPILDMNVNKFTVGAENWSSTLKADTALKMYVNVYNFAKSAWEPLVEPWQVGFGVARDQRTGALSVDVASRSTFDVTITTASIALFSKSFAFFARDQDVLSKPRGVEAPYRIRNYTGFDVVVRSKRHGSDEVSTVRIEDGQEIPWSFEDWERMRESLLRESESGNSVAVLLEGSGFDPVKNIPLSKEGEVLYALKPKTNDVLHRLCVDIKLGADNIKYVTLRSPLLVENETDLPVELGVYDAREGHLLKIEKVAPGEARPAPVGAVYLKSLLVRPDPGFGYGWSTETLWWKDLLLRPTKTMVCKGDHGEPFYFQMSARWDKSNPLTRNYPYMRVKLSAPVTLENLLPYDFNYVIYDKKTGKDWTNFLRKGGVSPVHIVELSHLLLLKVTMQDTHFKSSEVAIINSGAADDYKKDGHLVCCDDAGMALNLRLHYFRIPDGGGAFKVTVYSPYVILNKTGLDVAVRARGFMQRSKAAGEQLIDVGDGQERKTQPLMFSFGTDDHRNRATLQAGDSEWSRPQSLDAIGSTTELVLQSAGKNAEMHLGITVDSGSGKYKMIKTVTLAPRYVIQNKLGQDIQIREPRSSSFMVLKNGALRPLHYLQRGGTKQLCLCFPGVGNQWTAPFNISDLGVTHLKIARGRERQQLIRVEILMEDATIFLSIGMEQRNWPFSVRNESDTDFTFYQANPNMDEDGFEDTSGWKLIRYRLPRRSIMPYAWDFPAAKRKELCIVAHNKERHVKLAEIGNLMPMKLIAEDGQQKIIDINVTADGPTQTLILSNFKPSRSLYRQRSNAGSGASREGFEAKELDSNVTFRAQLRLAGIGVSLINAQVKELAYLTMRGVELKYTDSPLYQTVTFAVKWIQIDNQLYGGIFPMILYPSVVPKRAQEIETHPSLHAMVTRVKDDSYGVEYIKYATILLQEMTVDLDEDFIFAVLEFSRIPGASWSTTVEEDRLCDDRLDIPQPKQQQAGRDIYFEVLNIQPMQLDLSFVRTERVNVEDKTSSRNPVMFFLNVLLMAVGNVNDAQLRFNALMLENVRVSVPVLAQSIYNHYFQEAMGQTHKIIGSADFFGNPVGLFNNISSGFVDIFYEPYQGLIMSDRPEDFGLGLARGAGSFFKKSVYGFTDSFSKFTGSFAKGLAAATMDKQFQDRRRITRARNRPKHALFGVTAGANSLFTSVASGVGGLARKPLEGAEQEGALGFFKGIGKGVVGLATKPAIGVLDFASNVSEGVRNTTTVFDGAELDRVRLPRHIPASGVVPPYSQRDALGQSWLKQVDNGKYFDESYIAHIELRGEDGGSGMGMVLMVTYQHILLVRTRRLQTEWDVPLKDIHTIAKERTGLSLILRGGTNGPFIPIADEDQRAFIYGSIRIAVEEFNRRFRGLQ
ncbi:hypothetical protein VTJ49DRAFT_3105 [Mycothermus thermophilus]|uniref:Vacuolar protein sorting-associated protein n=1 Tax=Humicola insolens TaxID=85995 RepID=A0ABR3V8M0_HUMIN